jgi:mono/diheme cytochrome c family protein
MVKANPDVNEPAMRYPALALLGIALIHCGTPEDERSGDAGSPDAGPGLGVLQIVSVSGAPLAAVAGDALGLKVVQVQPGGAALDLPSDVSVTWSAPPTVVALPPYSTQQIPIWVFADIPTAYFIDNPGRPDHGMDLNGVLFVLDPGTSPGASVTVTAQVTSGTGAGQVTATVSVGQGLSGDAGAGAATYRACCSPCHGGSASGSPPLDGGFVLDGVIYPYPAPALNANRGNLAADPSWNAALLAMAARADMDNEGLTLQSPMPDWLSLPTASGDTLSTQDFADIYAFLTTQKP